MAQQLLSSQGVGSLGWTFPSTSLPDFFPFPFCFDLCFSWDLFGDEKSTSRAVAAGRVVPGWEFPSKFYTARNGLCTRRWRIGVLDLFILPLSSFSLLSFPFTSPLPAGPLRPDGPRTEHRRAPLFGRNFNTGRGRKTWRKSGRRSYAVGSFLVLRHVVLSLSLSSQNTGLFLLACGA